MVKQQIQIALLGGMILLGGIAFGAIAQEESLPPIPIPAAPSESAPPPSSAPIPPSQSVPNILPEASDLRQVVDIFVVESLSADESNLPSFQPLRQELARQPTIPGQPPIQREYNFIRDFLARYGSTDDRLLEPAEFAQLLNRPRPPIPSQQLSPGLVYFAVPEITPATANQIRQTLFQQDYSNGIVLDLRGSTGYDPRIIADVARLFVPRTTTPLVVSSDRTGVQTEWSGTTQSIAAGIPLLLFVDGGTQRGATLLAAILASRDHTAVAGQTTQGTEVQTQFFALPSEAAVELGVARWQLAGEGENNTNTVASGVIPARPLGPGEDWIARVPSLMPPSPMAQKTPTISIEEGRVGRFTLGLDLGKPNTGRLGIEDSFPRDSGESVLRLNSDLKLYHLEDYVIFGYRNRRTLNTYFADRIYMNAPRTYTVEGIGVGDSYTEVIATYGPPGENGYNEINPYPANSRLNLHQNLYFVNYDVLGLGFAFEAGTNTVQAIGLYKPGS